MAVIDWSTEEYAKLLLRLYGAYRCYDRVIVLEDAAATGPRLVESLLQASQSHTVDLLLLAHGQKGDRRPSRPGAGGARNIQPASADSQPVACTACPAGGLRAQLLWSFSGRAMACPGAQSVNGAVGVNWFPEPSLSVFLRCWRGAPFSVAVARSYAAASRCGRLLAVAAASAPWIRSSQQVVVGVRDVTVHTRLPEAAGQET
jgi:hypothetical protein